MKRITFSLSALLVLSALFTLNSCNKEEVSNGTQFRASMENCTSQNSKTTLSSTALNWQSDDRIAVYGTDGCGIYSATPQTPATTAIFDNVSGETGDPTFRAFYPTTLTTDGVNITLPATQTYVENSIHEFPMYAESSDNTLSFKNLCGALKLHLTANVNISTIAVTAANEINGTFSVNHNAGNPQLTHVSGGSNTTILSCATAQSIASSKDFFIYLPEGDYTSLQIELNTDDGRYCVKTANATISVTRSQYTLISLGESSLNFVEPLYEGTLPGLFTINADGDQVRFSQGNLQYQASTDTWRFAEHQYNYVGYGSSGNVYENGVKCRNEYISSTYTGWIDLFGWGTGNNPTNTSSNDANYGVFVDWGTNPISNGGNEPNQWRTLSGAEWNYIINIRANASQKKGACQINGVNGVILLSDNFVMPTDCSFNPGFGHGWTYNIYTLAQWEQMEASGAFFFPAAGNHGRYGYDGGGYNIRYWTSTMTQNYNADRLWSDNAQDLSINYGSGLFNRSRFSVRLARDNN